MSISVEVVDGVIGRAAEGIPVSLLRETGEGWERAGGGCADNLGLVPELGSSLGRGRYRLIVDLDRYYSLLGIEPFVSQVEVVFRLFSAGEHRKLMVAITPTSLFAFRAGSP